MRLVTLTGQVLHEWRSKQGTSLCARIAILTCNSVWQYAAHSDGWVRCGSELCHVRQPHRTFPFGQSSDIGAHPGRIAWTVLGTEGNERLFLTSRGTTWAALYSLRTGERLHLVRRRANVMDSFHCFPSLNVVLHITEYGPSETDYHYTPHPHCCTVGTHTP